MEFIVGVESELARETIALTIQLVENVHEEIRVYRRWWGEHRVDGILMVDLRVDDPRVEELTRLGLPAVVVGGPVENGSLPAVWHDEAGVVIEAVQYLSALGHRHIAQVAGVGEFVHTVQRTAAFRRATDDLGLQAEIVETDYSAESGARATRRLLSLPDAPTAIVFDSDLLAVTGLGVAQQMGFSVPDDVSIVGWDDSLISQVVHPPLTAITRDIQAFGVAAAAPARGGRWGGDDRRGNNARGADASRKHWTSSSDSVKNRLTLNRISEKVDDVRWMRPWHSRRDAQLPDLLPPSTAEQVLRPACRHARAPRHEEGIENDVNA